MYGVYRYVYVCGYMCMHICRHMYIERERERERLIESNVGFSGCLPNTYPMLENQMEHQTEKKHQLGLIVDGEKQG